MPLDSIESACRRVEQRLYRISDDPFATHVTKALSDACLLVRGLDPADPAFSDAVDRVSTTVDTGVDLAYSSLEIDYLPSFAHTREFPLIRGPNTLYHIFTPRIYEALSEAFKFIFDRWGSHPLVALWIWLISYIFVSRLPKPWAETPRPHPSSTPLSRFYRSPGSSSSTIFRAISEARCEISSNELAIEPIRIVNNGSCLVLPSMTGDRNQSPWLAYYLLDDLKDGSFPLTGRYVEVGLSEIAYAATTDEERKLIFLADSDRIKSYTWANRSTGELYDSAHPTHTLASRKHHGPLAVLNPGTLLRAGEGSAALWNLDGIATHGRSGTKRIGKTIQYEGWRSDYDDIEHSSGSKSISLIKFTDPHVCPALWHPHPSVSGTMLCTSDPTESQDYDYSLLSLDLAHGGKTVVRYFGAGGRTGDFSTSNRDPSVFAAAATDGHARLYDMRLPLPVLTVCASTGQEDCGGIALIHPDGNPALFTGSTKDEVIRLWDIRARKMVYELSTGNNSVNGMTWDDASNALYVSATCSYLDGGRRTYRRARLPPSMLPEPMPRHGLPNYDNKGSFDKCWPRQAVHSEQHYGTVFNAGTHRLFRYAFKEHPELVLPVYGSTTIREGTYY
ncbi:hypothetical protein B0H12DRAFT_1186935 [Mycena haematopus]|nr:hypothetical protein B0H12DRAFT_1186935 [Mycena haematopus]